jgi:hypothetical protein
MLNHDDVEALIARMEADLLASARRLRAATFRLYLVTRSVIPNDPRDN